MRRNRLIISAAAAAITTVFGGNISPATAGLLYQWNFDQNGGTGTSVSPAVTPNGLASDGGVLTMAQFGGIGPFAPTNLYTPSGGGVSGAAGDYAFDNSASASNNPTPGGITYSSGVAAANNVNTVNALPNFGGASTNPTFTLTMWVKPTTAELAVQSRLMEIGTTSTFDESTNGLWVGLNAGKVQAGGSSASANFIAGNTLVANTWNFIALEVDLTATNVFFDPTMQAATGSTLIGATAAQDSFVMYQGDQADNNYAYTYQNGWANGTMNFSGTQDYLQLLNRASNANRAFQGQGDDFRIYSGLLTTAQLQGIAAEAPVPEPATFASLIMAGGLLLRRPRSKK